jgi:serine/threonine protein kinase
VICLHCGSEIPEGSEVCPVCGQPPDVISQELPPDTLLKNGRYKIIKKLGQGGFGITYLAEDTTEGRKVVIKELFLQQCIRNPKDGKTVVLTSQKERVRFQKAKERMEKEAQVLKVINHPNVVKAYDSFEENGTYYIVLEYIEGESLKDRIKKEGKLKEKEARSIFEKILSGLKAIHTIGIAHRDVKPDNILITKEGKVKLIDFGTVTDIDTKSREITQIQSAGYTPVEINYAKAKVTPAYDIYSAGMTLYSMLSGRTENIQTPAERQLNDIVKIEVEREFNIRDRLRKVLLKSIEIKPEDRYQSTDEVLAALEGKERPSSKKEERNTITEEIEKEISSKKGVKFKWLGGIIVILAVFIGGWIAGKRIVEDQKEIAVKHFQGEKAVQVTENKPEKKKETATKNLEKIEVANKQERKYKETISAIAKPTLKVMKECDRVFGNSDDNVTNFIIQVKKGNYAVTNQTKPKSKDRNVRITYKKNENFENYIISKRKFTYSQAIKFCKSQNGILPSKKEFLNLRINKNNFFWSRDSLKGTLKIFVYNPIKGIFNPVNRDENHYVVCIVRR